MCVCVCVCSPSFPFVRKDINFILFVHSFFLFFIFMRSFIYFSLKMHLLKNKCEENCIWKLPESQLVTW